MLTDTTTTQDVRFLIIAGIALLAAAIVILQIPLVNYLGYEFSVVVALLMPWTCSVVLFRIVRSGRPDRLRLTVPEFTDAARRIFSLSHLLLLAPLLAGAFNLLMVRNCSFGEGLLWYLLLPVITTIFCSSVAVLSMLLFRRAVLGFVLLQVVQLSYSLSLGYTTPAIFSYNTLYGYFPGFSYDEVLSITPTILLFRALTFIAGITAFAVAREVVRARNGIQQHRPGSIRPLRVAVVIGVIILVTAWLRRDSLGFESSARFIQSALGSSCTTEHFVIYYSAGHYSEMEIREIAFRHEFAYAQVTRVLGSGGGGRIDSYIFPDADSKLRMIGTATTNIAKPWRREVYLDADSWKSTLRHELVHVIAGEFGMPVIHAHYNIGLVEGLATAIDGGFGNRTIDEYAAALLRFDLVHAPGRLIRPGGFALQSSAVSYMMMGSFCRYLISTHGIDHFKRLYGGSAVETSYGMTYDSLIAGWERHLRSIVVPDSWREHVEYYFKRPSIFAKECARVIAGLNQEGMRELGAHRPDAAADVFRRALATSWNAESFFGLVRSDFSRSRYDSVLIAITGYGSSGRDRSVILGLQLLYGDALWCLGDTLGAETSYRELAALDLSRRTNEAVRIRLLVLADPSLRDFPRVLRTVGSDSVGLNALRELKSTTGNPVLSLLSARHLLHMKRYQEASDELSFADSTLADNFLLSVRSELLAEVRLSLGDIDGAGRAFASAQSRAASRLQAERLQNEVEYCDWRMRAAPPPESLKISPVP